MPKPGIQLSKQLLRKLPAAEQDTLERISDRLWKKSGGNCFLCGAKMNRASDRIVADHEVAESEGKPSEVNRLSNLNLVHDECNAFKRNHPTAPVSSFLAFRRHLQGKESPLYSDCLSYFSLVPAKSQITRSGDTMKFEFPDGSRRTAHLFEESNLSGKFVSCFVDVPVSAIFHDEECQPRTIKEKQVWLIYSDLHRNPLHEPPACRTTTKSGSAKLLMFDGQHKTIASLLMKRARVPVKIYIDLSAERTRHLVNSIQAKIPKLGLSAFELMSKMGAEYRDSLAEYAEKVDDASEQGFLNYVPADQRRRAKQAFENACISNVWDDPSLELVKVFKTQATKGKGALTEKKIKDKLLRPLLSLKPMAEPFEQSELVREREKDLVCTIVNSWVEHALLPKGKLPDKTEKVAIDRRTKQPSIEYVSRLIRKAAAHVLKIEDADSLGIKAATDSEIAAIDKIVKRIASHGLWTHAYSTKAMNALQDALAKNQDAERVFRALGLDLGYALTGDLAKGWAGE